MRDWCWARVWREQRASPSLLADRLGALNHSLRCVSAFVSSRFSRSRPFGCNCQRLRSRLSQMASECVGHPTSTPLILWLRVLSYDDHPVLNLVAQEHEKDSKLSSSLPHLCACCAKVLCATLHSVVGVQTVPHLSPLSSACSCASTSCRSSSHCVSWLSQSSTSVLSTFASSEHSHSPRSVTRCMSSRHRGQLSVAVEAVANSSRSDLVFTKALLSCAPCPQETARASRLVLTSSIPRGDCPRSGAYRLHSITSRSARPGARHHSSRTYATRPVPSWPPQPSLSTRWTNCVATNHTRCTVDRNIRAKTSNSLQLSLCHCHEVIKRFIDDLLCSSLTPEARLAARFPSSPWYELCCRTTDPCSARSCPCSRRSVESTPSARTASVHFRDILPLTPKSP